MTAMETLVSSGVLLAARTFGETVVTMAKELQSRFLYDCVKEWVKCGLKLLAGVNKVKSKVVFQLCSPFGQTWEKAQHSLEDTKYKNKIMILRTTFSKPDCTFICVYLWSTFDWTYLTEKPLEVT